MNDALKSTRSTLSVDGREFEIFRLDSVPGIDLDRLPYSLKILLENLLRHYDGVNVTDDDIRAVVDWNAKAEPSQEIAFTPSRVILQDFTGVPAIVDLAAMRDAVVRLGGSASDINPLSPAELVIDHSVQVDNYGSATALALNNEIEFRRNRERYQFLRWGQRRRASGLPRHRCGHRFAYHHDQWSRRAGLGCRRHRSRGRHARPGDYDAGAPGHRCEAHRQPAGGCHRHGPGAHGYRAAS